MRIYQQETMIDDKELFDLGPIEPLGGTLIAGNPRIAARFDYQANGVSAGVFEATTGKAKVRFPFTEFATIIEGEVEITDESGQTHVYRPGESYFIEQGQVVIWEVRGPRVRKAFFNIVPQELAGQPDLKRDDQLSHSVEQTLA